jgi:yeast amino acid transporter
MTSVLSAGNGLLFSATRTLFGMSMEGTAPKFFSKTLKSGVPIYCVLASLSVGLLAFLQASNNSAKVLTWLVYLITACQLLNYFSVCLTYRHFYSALKHQGIDRNSLPYKSRFQPYTSYIAMFSTALMLFLLGYDLFIKGGWSLLYFFLDYTFLAVFPLAVIFWKVVKRTKYVKPGTADLTVDGMVPAIDQYEQSIADDSDPTLHGAIKGIFEGMRMKMK